MNDRDKTKEQLISELVALQKRVADLEAFEDERRQVEEALREGEATTEAVCVIDHDGKVIDVNAAFERLTGYIRDELIGQAPLKLHPERERRRISTGMRECMEKGIVRDFETVFLRKDKEEIPILLEFYTYPSKAEQTGVYSEATEYHLLR